MSSGTAEIHPAGLLSNEPGPAGAPGFGPARIIARLVVVLIVGWAFAALILIAAAVGHLRSGDASIGGAAAAIQPSSVTSSSSPDVIEPVRTNFAAAATDLRSPLLAPLRILPIAGRQLKASTAIASAAAQAATVTEDALISLQAGLARPQTKPQDRLQTVQAVAAAAGAAADQLGQIRVGSPSGLLSSIEHRRTTVLARLEVVRSGFQRTSTAANAVLTTLIGPRHYLVLAGNNAEMRSGSAIFEAATTVDISGGRVTVGNVVNTSTLALPPTAVPLGGDMASLWGFLTPNAEWRNLGLSPRFDQTAALAASMWKANTGQNVDGVIAVDASTMQGILSATGPVDVGTQLVDAGSVLPLVLHDQYIGRSSATDASGLVAAAALGALNKGTFNLSTLAAALADAIAGRHLLVWSVHPDEEAMWRAAGAAGTMAPDSLLVSVINRGANKLDTFLAVSTDLEVAPGPRATRVVARIHLSNTEPAGEPPAIVGSAGESQPGTYFGYVAVTIPGSATKVSVNGQATANVSGPDGPDQVVAVLERVAAGDTVTVDVQFTLPGRHGDMQIESAGRAPGAFYRIVRPTGSAQFSDAGHPRVVW